MKNSIAIVILFFNKCSETIECIESFLPSKQKIYLLNNGSNKTLWSNIKLRYQNNEQIVFIHSDENLGPSKGRNKCIEDSKEEWLFFVDNDITILEKYEWKDRLNDLILKYPTIEIFCPRLFNVHENEYVKHPNFLLKNNTISLIQSNNEYTNYFPSGASIIKRSIFKNYGLFAQDIFAFEDYEYAIRMLVSSKYQLKVQNIFDINLCHNHRYQKNKSDKQAVEVRYNTEKLAISFNWIQKKHSITFEHDWDWWSKKQLYDMTKKESYFQRIKGWISLIYSK